MEAPHLARDPRSTALSAPLLVALSLAAGIVANPAAAGGDASAILGVWRGTSTCTDREIAPACSDEIVVYRFLAIPGKPATTVRLEADKIVGGKPERMGEIDFTLDAATGAWTSEFRNARYHGLWSYTVDGKRLTGTLVDVPTGKVVRRIATQRD
jgi:hypothetical protein